jgi:hypothetical protein
MSDLPTLATSHCCCHALMLHMSSGVSADTVTNRRYKRPASRHEDALVGSSGAGSSSPPDPSQAASRAGREDMRGRCS